MTAQLSATAPEGLDEGAVAEFQHTLRGELIRPGDAGYEEARRLHNGMIDKRPALIVRCAGVADVIHAGRFAPARAVVVAGPGVRPHGSATPAGPRGVGIDPR